MARIISLVAIVLMSACSGGSQSSTGIDSNDVATAVSETSSSTAGGQTTTSEDADSSFSMVFTSDPQFFRRMNFVEQKGGVDETADCADPSGLIIHRNGSVGRDNVLCDPVSTNEAVVDAIGKITDLEKWPLSWDCSNPDRNPENGCLTQGAGLPITTPVVVIMNGDLAEDSDIPQTNVYNTIYDPANFSQPLYEGLGNHDFGTNTKPNRARNSVEWMSNRLESLPSLANHDMQGIVHVQNHIELRRVRFRVKANGTKTPWEVIRAGLIPSWGERLVRRGGQNVSVQFQEKLVGFLGEWRNIETIDISDPVNNVCFRVLKANTVEQFACPLSRTESLLADRLTSRTGSLSYSFTKGRYHFIQLHNHLDYEVDLTDVSSIPRHQGFNVKTQRAWLENDLTNATSEGKAIIINVHDHSGLRPLITDGDNNWNIVAVFAGHKHQELGRFGIWPVKKSDGTVVRKIPVLLSGAGFCGTMLYADFHEDYFNWSTVRAYGQEKERPDTVGFFDQSDVLLQYAVGEPAFVEDTAWNCLGKTKEDKDFHEHLKQGTVDTSTPEPTDPPVAICKDVTVEAAESCSADANINDSSYDPEGGALTLTQSPLGPYGPGETLVTLTAIDESAVSASCQATVTVVDTSTPVISCNIPDAGPPDAPLSITATATDNCSVSDVFISDPDCFKINGAGKRVDLNSSCKWARSGSTLDIFNTGGVGTQYDWSATAIDENGNEAAANCHLEIQNPGL